MSYLIKLLALITNIMVYFLWIRFFLQWNNAPINNVLTRNIVKIANPIIKPFQRLIGSYNNINVGILLLMLIINCLFIVILIYATTLSWPDIGGLILWAFIKMILQGSQVLFYATILYALMSWFPSLIQSALGQCILSIIHPIIQLFRRFIPTVGIFDFSAMVLLIAIIALRYFLSPLLLKAVSLALA